MTFLTEHAIFFLVGLLQDLLVTSYYKAISDKQPVSSAALSGIVTIVNLTVFYGILSSLDQSVFSKIVVYALGNALGTYLIVWRDKRKHALPTTL